MRRFDRREFRKELLCQNQSGARCQRTGSSGPVGACGGVDAHDFGEFLVVERIVVRRLVDLRDLESRFDGSLDGLRKFRDVARIHVERPFRCIRLRIKVAGVEERLAAQCRILRLRRDAVIFAGSPLELSALPIDERDLFGDLAL